MSLDDAQVRAKQLNKQTTIKRQEERNKKIEESYADYKLKNQAYLPEEFSAEFENRFVKPHSFLDEKDKKRHHKRRYTIWRATQKLIVSLGIEPSEWFFHSSEIYEYFYDRQLSLGYINSILKMANLWGHFICRKLNRPYLFIQKPRGYEQRRLIEAYYRKQHPKQTPSAPLNPDELSSAKNKMNAKNFNWLYLSVWFGLRPLEIDNLQNPEMWKTEILPTGRKILWVFQTKIIALPPEDRWKPIPILFDEQHFALKIIEDRNFKRPLLKTIRKHLGPKLTLYGGRKGFVDLMLSKGHSIENISIWMGHSTLSRTWRSYKNKRVYHF